MLVPLRHPVQKYKKDKEKQSLSFTVHCPSTKTAKITDFDPEITSALRCTCTSAKEHQTCTSD